MVEGPRSLFMTGCILDAFCLSKQKAIRMEDSLDPKCFDPPL